MGFQLEKDENLQIKVKIYKIFFSVFYPHWNEARIEPHSYKNWNPTLGAILNFDGNSVQKGGEIAGGVSD